MKFILPKFLLLSLLFLLSTSKTSAQVVINEFSSGSTSDWIEIYNTATESADLSIYKIKDSTESNDKVLSGILVPGGIIFFTFSNFLNNSGDIVRLFKSDILVDSINYGDQGGTCAADSSQSIGRFPDGTGGIVRFSSQTQGNENSSPQSSCPTATPDPTTTPTQTTTTAATQAPTPTSTKTPTPTPTKTSTPKPSATSSTKPTEQPESEVIGVSTEISPSPTQTSEESGIKKKFPFLPVIFIGSGVLMVGFAVYNLIRAKSLPVQN